jgi:hypothetical protein
LPCSEATLSESPLITAKPKPTVSCKDEAMVDG